MGDEHPKIVVKQEEDSSSDGDFPDKSSGDSFNSGEGMPTETLRSRKRDRMERSRTHEQKVNDKIRTPPSQTSSERGYRNPIRRSDSDVCSNTKGSTRLPKRRCTKSVNYKEIEPSDDDHEVDYECCSQHSGRSATNSVKPTQRSSRSSNSSNNNNGSSSSNSNSSSSSSSSSSNRGANQPSVVSHKVTPKKTWMDLAKAKRARRRLMIKYLNRCKQRWRDVYDPSSGGESKVIKIKITHAARGAGAASVYLDGSDAEKNTLVKGLRPTNKLFLDSVIEELDGQDSENIAHALNAKIGDPVSIFRIDQFKLKKTQKNGDKRKYNYSGYIHFTASDLPENSSDYVKNEVSRDRNPEKDVPKPRETITSQTCQPSCEAAKYKRLFNEEKKKSERLRSENSKLQKEMNDLREKEERLRLKIENILNAANN